MTQKISISKILSLFFLTYSLNYCKKDSCCEDCCDCLYSVEIENDPSGNLLPIKNKGNIVIKLEQSSIDNIVEVVKQNNRNQSILLCGASILTESNNIKGYEDMKKKVEKIFNDENNQDFNNLNFKVLSPLEKRSIGSMLGMGIGDAYGAIFEFKRVKKKLYNADNYKVFDKKFKSNIAWTWGKSGTHCGWTDDSSMGLCLADSLIVNNGSFNPQDIMRRFLAWWYCGYNNASMYQKTKSISWGLGGNISDSFKNYISNPVDFTTAGGDKGKYISGNGSIMRNAAIPIAYHNDLNLAMENAKKQSKVTHQGNEAAGCCRLLTYIVWKILNENNNDKFNNGLKGYLEEILSEENVNKLNLVTDSVKGLALSKKSVESDKDKGSYENWNWKNKIFKYNETRSNDSPGYIGAYAMDNMAMSLHILYHTNSFEQAINVAVHLSGDADSVASVVGQIAGAFYGVENIPANWIKKMYVFDHGDFTFKALLLAHLFDEES